MSFRNAFGWVLLGWALVFSPSAADGAPATLRVFFIDVEGGQATLFVTSQGESLLIDTGWPGANGRDADRIVAAAKKAGISKIDYVLLTHYHVDHAGGIPQLLERIPVGTFLDHGPNRELDQGITEKDYALYQQALTKGKYPNLHLKPGEVLPIAGMTATVVSSDGAVIDKPLSDPILGAGAADPYCQASEVRPADETENARSLGIVIVFGKFRIVDLGDLTWDKERQLMCPVNRLGHVDVNIVSHHGWLASSSPALVDAIGARVAVMDNGARKGGSTATLKTIRSAPGLETLWQLHSSIEGGAENNTSPEFIANPASQSGEDSGYGIELVAHPDGSFDVLNQRTGAIKSYPAR